MGWKAAVLSWILPSFFWGGGGGGGGLSFPCPHCFRLAVPTVLLSRLLEFLALFAGVLSSRFHCLLVARGGWQIVLGYLPSVAWLRWVLPCFSVSGLSASPSGAAVPLGSWSCGIQGLRDGVTCLGSGLCSSSVHDRNEDFPSFWWVWFLAFVLGSPTSGQSCVLQPAIVPEAIPPSSRIGPALSRWVPLLRTRCVWGLQPFARTGGVASASVYSFGMWSPLGSSVSFCHLIANEGLHWWLFLADVATLFLGQVVIFIRPPSDRRNFLWLCSCLACHFVLCQWAVFSWPHMLLRYES